MRSDRLLLISFYTTFWFQILFILVTGLFVLRVYLAIGHLPVPYNPDPANVGFGFHHTVSVFFLALIQWVIWVGLVLSIISFFRKRIPYPRLISFWCISVLLLIWVYTDPYQLNEWILD